ncbi:MAG: 2-amino-4-hydroxy-6-hydroxymethyldihydropteridine diphosphokinase [Rhodospirillales bacterium]|nr:2-amino-4-hydroxy-6-hydroxymethyldihydropteridine diphosphokinase [Rhodospirillales bacterium]
MILLGLGANLPSRYGTPEKTLRAALAGLERKGVRVVKASSIWLSAPVPVSDQPWYRNAVVAVKTDLSPEALMGVLQGIENDFGRVRGERNAPRLLDLDVLIYDDLVITDETCQVPHPRMDQRAFVLKPLEEIAPDWIHPVLGLSVADLIATMPEGQEIEVSEKLAA